MIQNDTAVMMLLMVHMLALAVACAFCAAIVVLRRRTLRLESAPKPFVTIPDIFQRRPTSWLAIRAVNPETVQAALGLSRAAPCSWSEGMMGEHEFFVSPRVNGWVIVTGIAIPTPDDDVDDCFRFLVSLSRKLGHVQFFFAEKFSRHHAWARLDDGCVTRAYAWAGETVWNQGAKTVPEIGLGLECFGYGEECPPKSAMANANKIPQLAARWNFDPAAVDERVLNRAVGVAGELPQIY